MTQIITLWSKHLIRLNSFNKDHNFLFFFSRNSIRFCSQHKFVFHVFYSSGHILIGSKTQIQIVSQHIQLFIVCLWAKSFSFSFWFSSFLPIIEHEWHLCAFWSMECWFIAYSGRHVYKYSTFSSIFLFFLSSIGFTTVCFHNNARPLNRSPSTSRSLWTAKWFLFDFSHLFCSKFLSIRGTQFRYRWKYFQKFIAFVAHQIFR